MSDPTNARPFHLGDILSITGEKLVSPRLMEGVYDILNFMTGDNLFTHQLPRACRACKPVLLTQHPVLADVDDSGCTAETWHAWMAEQVERYGETLLVQPLPPGDWQHRNPLTELQEIAGDRPVIVVETGDDA